MAVQVLPRTSSAISKAVYDDAAKMLFITFVKDGLTYAYKNVPQAEYDGLAAAGSVGQYFNAHIRDNYAT
jgi:hypothetical protein